ncbi:MAG: ribbon-helix-helix domain-containing protein [Candidatus Daviesbacteria bacterium]|nr:ribbon-helix-helix domain-containing protein [Candidatus Daviesbacteria bacterium]
MTTTINISMPDKLYKAAKKLVQEGKYHSISEVVRAGLRRVIYGADKITENGFAGWFEDAVLESAAEPVKKNAVAWETEEDIDNYFKKLHKRIDKKKQVKYGKDRTNA